MDLSRIKLGFESFVTKARQWRTQDTTVSKPDGNSKLGSQSSVSNSDRDPLQCNSDHASLPEHLQKSLSLIDERQREGDAEENEVAVKIWNEEERGNEVREHAKSEESIGDIKATENEEKAEYDWIGAAKHEKHDEYDWTGADEPEKRVEYDWVGTDEHENKGEYGWNGASKHVNKGEYGWNGASEHENNGDYGWNGGDEHENKGEYGWNGASEHVNKGEYGWNGASEHENKGEYGWNGAAQHENKGECGWNGADEHGNRDGRSHNGSYYGSSDNNYARKYLIPVRPEVGDCAYYVRRGTCKFGSNCKFNHPVLRKNQVTKEKVKEWEDLPENPGQTECKYNLRTGRCKFENARRYNHSRAKVTVVHQTEELNFLGLPIRPGEKECPYYMRNGSCKYGANCKFNHPDPTAVGGSDPASGYGNGGSATLQSTSQSSVDPRSSPRTINETAPFVPVLFSPAQVVPPQSPEWNDFQGEKECPFYMRNGFCKYGANCKFNHPDHTAAGGSDPASGYGNGGSATLQSTSQSSVDPRSSPRTINETAPFVQVMFSPAQVVPPQSPEWNDFQAPLCPPERSIHPAPAYVMTNPATETNAYTHHQEPQKPAMKTGDRKFKMNRKFHNPKGRISKSPPCALSEMGLPLRPDQKICSQYSRHGICKFGPACKFDHPIQHSSTVSSPDHRRSFCDSVTAGVDTMAGNGKGNANGTLPSR